MKSAPATINDPTFGPCTRVRSLIAVRWATPQTAQQAAAKASRASLNVANESEAAAKRVGATKGRRDPADLAVNHSELLTWFRATREISATALSKIENDSDIAWTAPVYRAKQSEEGPRSYFAITPTVLVLSEAALAAAGDAGSIDPAATINRTRSALLNGYVVIDLPEQNAIEVAARLQKLDALQGIPNAISFEHTPYISPICCGCGGGDAPAKRECSPDSAPYTPNDPLFPNEWGLQRINAPRAWTVSKGDPNVVIAVLDQGVDLAHPDINLWPVSYSTITHTNNGGPVGNHGTACAGIIGGRIGNSLGVTGLAGDARVMAIATNFADVEVAEGLNYAADNGARVVSMSFGVYPSWGVWNFAIIQPALQYCQQKNLVLCAASGNENIPQSRFPGSDPATICVGGSNRADVRKSIGDTSSEAWWGACYGPDLDVVAPCLEIPTTDRLGAAGYTPGDYDLFFNGTSSATPHVAALCGLILSVDGDLTNADVRRIVSETTDKINSGGYVYANTAGKPYGTWTNEAGYGRINAERALLAACSIDECRTAGPCGVALPKPEACCVSPCDPPWRPDAQCMVWYEDKYLRVPIVRRDKQPVAVTTPTNNYIEFRVTYEHRMCLLGKQHGPLLFTTTLLPGETIRLYHSDRYRRITTAQQRFSVQSTFMQFLSLVHQARVTNSIDSLNRKLSGSSSSQGSSEGGGFFFGLFGGGGSSESSSSSFASSESELATHFASDLFQQSIFQSSQLTQIERSVVVSTYEEKDVQDITVRTLHNANECRAVTYFVRQIVELYAVSTRVVDVSYRIVAPNVPDLWHSIQDLGWLPAPIRNEIQQIIPLLPRVGEVVTAPRPLSLPTDGTVYDPELAHCCSCEPERAAAITIRLEKAKAEALKACLEAQELEIEIQRRRLLLQKGELAPFESAAPLTAPAPAG